MKLVRRFFVFWLLLFVFLIPSNVLAEESIRDFKSQLLLHRDGSMDVVEIIVYDFGEGERHGIYRYINLSSKLGDRVYRNLDLKFGRVERDGRKEPNEISKDGDKIEVKIGDADRTISGVHVYKVPYSVKNAVGNLDDHDEIYWNVTGDDWDYPIGSVSAVVSTDFGVGINQVKCFTGSLGETAQDCLSSVKDSSASFSTKSELNSGEGLTVVAGFPVNTFPKSQLSDRPLSALANWQIFLIGLGVVIYYLILPGSLFFWYLVHKRKNRFGKVSVNFDFPKDSKGVRIPPSEAGAIDTSKLEKDDVTATIFDLAIRKYVKLSDKMPSKLMGISLSKSKNFIEKVKGKNVDELNEYEQTLYYRLFRGGDIVETESLSEDFYETFNKMQKSVFSSLVARGYYKKDPAGQRGGFVAGGILGLFTLNIFLAGVMFWFARVMNGRTEEGDAKDWEVDGLKIFLKNMAREYKFQVKNLITVEKYIPYAIALGYIDEFMEQLKTIYPDYDPSWYSGTRSGGFYNFYPAFASGMSSSISTSAPSSSSGFSGGGSSGGGGGGGGGGSW